MALTLVKVTPASGVAFGYLPGPQSQAIGNAAGNALVVMAAWNASAQAAGFTGAVPSGSVADSAGNWWRLCADSGPSCPAARCAVWVCDSALAVPATGWWSFALQGYASAAAWAVAEFSGAPSGWEPAVDFTAAASTGAAGSASSVTLGGTTGQADWCFAIACAAGADDTVTPPGGSWSTIATGGDGDGGAIGAALAWGAFGSAASVSATFALGTPTSAAGVLVALSQASYPPSQPNLNFPAVRVEAALGADGGSPSQALPESAWTDMTSRAVTKEGVAGITVSRGREYELAEPEAGVLDILLNNVDGAYDPLWPGSPYYSNAINENMSFQSGIAPWAAHISTGAFPSLAQSSAYSYASGLNAVPAYSAELSLGTAPAVNPGMASEFVPVSVNYEYTGSAWFYLGSGTARAQADINWYGTGRTLISGSSGTAQPLGSGTWTQAAITATPPSGAAYAHLIPQLAGTYSSTTAYVAEAALVPGTAPVSTGLVALGTPVRVSAYWEGHRYPVGYGYVERWPQEWPDMPQWGFSPLVATDAAGAAASANIPSAVQGEILADSPYLCLPFNDQYTSSTNTTDGPQLAAISASGLIAANTSRVNQQSAVYAGGAGGIATGQSLSFLGDSGTGMGVSSLGSVDTANVRGSGAVYGPDPGLPGLSASAGGSFEFWLTMPTVANPGTAQYFPMLQLFGQPYIGSISPNDSAPGWVAALGVYLPATSGEPELFVEQSTYSGPVPVSDGFLPFGGLNHVVMTVAPGGLCELYVNGTLYFGASPADLPLGPLAAVTFGQAGYSYGPSWPLWNYALAYGCVYPYALPEGRVTAHYESGSAGFAGDSFAVRAGRYLAWGNAGLNPAGPGSIADAMELGAAYGTDGSSLASALNSDAQSSGGQWRASAGGNLVIVPRPAFYGLPSTVTFGDDPALGEIPFTVGDLDYDNTYLKNVVQATLTQGPNTLIAPVEKNLASEAQYGARGPLSLSVSGQSAEDAYDAASWNLSKYAQPQMRVREITVDAAGYPPALTAVLSTDTGAVATVNRRPLGGPSYSLPVTAEQVSHSIGPGLWKTTYQLSPYVQEASVLQADTSGESILGDGALAWLPVPLSPGSFPSDSPVTAKSLNTSLYTFTPGNQFTPNGILFAATRPLLVEGLIGTALTQPSSAAGTWHSITGSGDWRNYFDSAALYGGGADTQWSTAAGTLNPAVAGSDGSSSDPAGGVYLAWGYAVITATTHAGGTGAGLDEDGTIVAGGLQLSSTTQENAAYALDLVQASNGELTSLQGYCADSSAGSFTIDNYATDYSGHLTRFWGMWASVSSGGSALASVPSVTSWAQGGTVTSALLNGDAIGNPLNLLAYPPALRAGAALTTAVGDGSTVTVPLGGAQIDTYGAWSSSSHEWTVPLTGVYLVHGMAYYGTATTANVQAGLAVNGTALTLWGPAYTAAGSGSTAPQITRLLDLQAGDTVALVTTTDAAGGNDLGNAYPSRIVSLWLSALAPSNGAWSWTPPDTGFRWQAGTPGSALTTQFAQHLTNDLSFLIERPYLLTYQNVAQTGLLQNEFHTITMASPPAGRVHASAGDPYGGWQTGSGGYYEAPVAGWYLVVAGYAQAPPASTPASLIAAILQDPAGARSPDWYQQMSTTSGSLLPGAEAIGAYYLREGDTVQPQYQQLSGGTFSTTVAAGHECSFGCVWLSS